MILYNERLDDFTLRGGATVHGIGLGSYGPQQSCFIIPIKSHRDEEIDPRAWGLRPSLAGKPQIVANQDRRTGVIARLTTYNRPGIRRGRIFAVDVGSLDETMVVGYGIGGSEDGGLLYEEAVVQVIGTAQFYLENVGPPDCLIHIVGEEVTVEELAPDQAAERVGGELVRIDEPRLVRWKITRPKT